MGKYFRLCKRWGLLLSFICPLSLFSQTVEELIKSDMDSLRAGGISVHDYQIDSTSERRVLSFLKRYENDANASVRLQVRIIKSSIAQKSRDTLVRQQIGESLLEDCLFKEPELLQYATERLKDFNEHDFSPKAKQLIVSIFNKGQYENDFLLICGTAQAKQLIPSLKKIAAGFDRTQEGWARSPAWYASLALIRMGEPEKLNAVISAVELELNPVYRVTFLLRQIAYTRHPDCVKLLRKYLESSERLPELREGNKGAAYNQYALDYLARYIEGFPVQYKTTGYTAADLQTARSFFKGMEEKVSRGHD